MEAERTIRMCYIRANHWDCTQAIPRSIEAGGKIFERIEILCWNRDASDLPAHEEQGRRHIHRFTMTAPPRSAKILLMTFLYQMWLIYKMLRIRADFVQVCDFDSAIPAALICFFTRRTLIYDIRDPIIYSYKLPKPARWLLYGCDWCIMGLSKGIVIPSEERKFYLSCWQRRRAVAVVLNTCRDQYAEIQKAAADDAPPQCPIVSYIGYINPSRGADVLMRLAESGENVEVHVAGSIRSDAVRDRLEKSGGMKMLGKLSRLDTLRLMKRSSAVSLLYDPAVRINQIAAPNKFYEAMSMGTPVIVSNGMSLAKPVREHGLGWIIPYNNLDALQSVVGEMQKDDVMRTVRGRCRKFFEKHGAYDLELSRYAKFYRSLI